MYDSDGFVLEVGRLPVEAVARLGIIRGATRLSKEVVLGKSNVRGRKIVTNRPEAWRRHEDRLRFRIPGRRSTAAIRMTSGEAVIVPRSRRTRLPPRRA